MAKGRDDAVKTVTIMVIITVEPCMSFVTNWR